MFYHPHQPQPSLVPVNFYFLEPLTLLFRNPRFQTPLYRILPFSPIHSSLISISFALHVGGFPTQVKSVLARTSSVTLEHLAKAGQRQFLLITDSGTRYNVLASAWYNKSCQSTFRRERPEWNPCKVQIARIIPYFKTRTATTTVVTTSVRHPRPIMAIYLQLLFDLVRCPA